MDQQNYYLLLELPYDPPEHNYDNIKKAIQKKRSLWTRRLSNATYRSEAESFLRMMERMEKDMQDHSFRETEAQAAKWLHDKEQQQKEKEKYEKLNKVILILSKKGYVLEEEVESIQKDLGFTTNEVITNIVSVPIKTNKSGAKHKETKSGRPALTKEKMKSICDLLDKLIDQPRVGKVTSLYDLLELPEGTGELDLHDKANAEYKLLSSKGVVSGELLIKKDALSQALTVFKDKETRLKYDESLKMKRFESIAQYVKVAGCTGELEKSVYEELRIQAMNEGLSSADSEVRIKRVCDDENIAIVSKQQQAKQPIVELEHCGNCGLVNKAKGVSCTGCGQPLKIECKKCGVTSPSSSEHCSRCGISFISFYYQEHYLKRAEWALVNKDYVTAEAMVERAKYYWDGLAAIETLTDKITSFYRLVDKRVQKVEELMKASKFYSAERELNILKRTHPNLDTIPTFERDIRRQINGAESYINRAKIAATDQEKISLLLSSLEESVDCQTALTELSKYPPEPPTEVRAGITQDAIKLEWNSPYKQNDVMYEIYRKEEGTTMAKKVADTPHCVYADKKAEAGKRYSYYVQTIQGSKVSAKSSMISNLMKTSEVDSLKAQVKNEGIQVLWKSPGNTKIEVWRKEGSLPEGRGDGIKLSGVTQNNVLDINVESNKEYGYLVIVQYKDQQGKPFFSRGSGLMAVTSNESIGAISVDEQKDYIHFNWKPRLNGDIKLFYSDFPFDEYKPNECWSYSKIVRESGNEVVEIVSEGKAIKARNFSGFLHVLPVLKIGSSAIIGETFVLKSIQPVTKVVGRREQNDLILQWQWPEDTQKVTIRYSEKGFQDSAAEERECQRFSYKKFNGYKIDSIRESRDIFVTVFVTEEWEGEKFHSKPVQYLFTEREPMEIRYSLTIQRKMLGLKKEAFLKIKMPEYGIPNLTLVKQKGRIPNRKSDGEIIQVIDNPNGEYTKEYIISLNDYLEEDSYAKLFFETKEDALNYKIVAEPGTKFALFS
ncbi:hypothetical protein JNUCC23_02570 [Peribacillus sp. JNUCC 23]